ncbi:hypothetical protein QR680_004103 [Steinernema hermaphroditum]|uniref:Uncharacterized protein n=1 Tax=Steinernema hermaphroditum TaxID=289476 RepID=A0AA39LSN9_9BILA|nr:hypothetical protein QR680_004103 [Steinernema hermaphroditum]
MKRKASGRRGQPAKRQYDGPNDFAFLSQDVIKDVLDVEMNPESMRTGTFGKMALIGGPWRRLVRGYSYLKCNWDKEDPVLVRFFGKHGHKEVQQHQMKYGELIVKVNCTGDLASRKNKNFCSLFSKMTDTLEIRGSYSEMASTLKILPARFSEINLLFGSREAPTPKHYKQFSERLTAMLKSKHLRKFELFHHDHIEKHVEFPSCLEDFVTKPDFELFKTDVPLSMDLLVHAIDAWRKRCMFTVSQQQIYIHTRVWKSIMKEFTSKIVPKWEYNDEESWKWSEQHPKDPERYLEIEALSSCDRVTVYFFHKSQ